MAFSAAPGSFEWRASTGRWRWLMLGTLGVAATSCGVDLGGEQPGGGLGQGGSEATSGTPVASTPDTSTTNPSPTTPSTTSPSPTEPIGTPTPARAPGSVCINPTPLGGGWERCGNGLIHRAERSGACEYLARDARISEAVLRLHYPDWDPNTSDRPPQVPCIRDSECTERPAGRCAIGSEPYSIGISCSYGCQTDGDCGENAVCLCEGQGGRCVSSECATDTDCPQGMCASYTASPGCSHDAFACQTVQDECVTSADCGGETCTIETYSDVHPKSRFCSPNTVVCGRPFLIAGDARRAEPTIRADWYPDAGPASVAGAEPELDAELRTLVAQGWLEQGLMEHASVAAFGRFSLQLLSLGAPAELVSDASLAMADEIVHARDCFALARRHSARDAGPGALPLAGALEELDLTAIVLGTIAEGCIGETVAALEAAEAQAHCQDETARAVLARISADETRHAQLAWRFVAWALERGPGRLRQEVRKAFERELMSVPTGSSSALALSATEHRLLQQGLVGPELRSALRVRVLHDVIAPCARALLDEPAPRARPAFAHASV